MTPYPLTIIVERIAEIERGHEHMWLCRNVLGGVVLQYHEPRLISCQSFAAYRGGLWFDGDAQITRMEVARLLCIVRAD